MNALIPFTSGPSNLPPARANLVALNDRLAESEQKLEVLHSGKRALESELARVSEAKAELSTSVAASAQSLTNLIRSGATWSISAITNSRAKSLAQQLAESRVESEVGKQALTSIAEEIAELERSIADLKARKSDTVRAVMVEAASGFHADLATLADELRQLLAILSGLDRVITLEDGSWSPSQRLVVTFPAVGGVAESVVVAPTSSIERARDIWVNFQRMLADDPMASAGDLVFPNVTGHEDDGRVPYENLSPVERRILDSKAMNGRLVGVPREAAE